VDDAITRQSTAEPVEAPERPVAPAAPGYPDGLPTPRRYWAIATIWLAIAMSVLDGAIANVALPTIARDLNAAPGTSIWIVNAYQLAITVALLPLASLGDKLGYRRVYLAGLAVFTLGSLACALSNDLTTLAAARVLQGLGAAGLMSLTPPWCGSPIPPGCSGAGSASTPWWSPWPL
jgi:DHA2 family multidrug resistance protein-like MFS transporter